MEGKRRGRGKKGGVKGKKRKRTKKRKKVEGNGGEMRLFQLQFLVLLLIQYSTNSCV